MGNFNLFLEVPVFLNVKIALWVHKFYNIIDKIPLLCLISPVMFIGSETLSCAKAE